jgi:hypothetical protein
MNERESKKQCEADPFGLPDGERNEKWGLAM